MLDGARQLPSEIEVESTSNDLNPRGWFMARVENHGKLCFDHVD